MFGALLKSSRAIYARQPVRHFSFAGLGQTTRLEQNGLQHGLGGLSSTRLAQAQTTTTPSYSSGIIITSLSPLSNFVQRRWGTRGGNRGNTYQPNTLKRKRRLGFLARMKSRTGRRIVKARKEKGRWFLTY